MLSLKLLVVEDDPASLELMTEVLESLEAEVRPVSDSQEAAILVNQEKFDGVFLDLEMPNLDGFAFATGATFFLQKPVDRHKLARLFRTVRGTMIENRRRYARVPLQTEVTCTVGSKTIRGRTWNLSQGGIQVEAGNLQPGETVRLAFRLSGSAVMIDTFGTVVWAKQTRQGIRFAQMTNQNQEAIREFISQVESP